MFLCQEVNSLSGSPAGLPSISRQTPCVDLPYLVQPIHELSPAPLLLSLPETGCDVMARRPEGLGADPSSFANSDVTSGDLVNYSEPCCYFCEMGILIGLLRFKSVRHGT